MKLLLIAPAGLEVQGVKGKHVHHLNLAVIAALAAPYFDEIRIVEEEFERLDPNERADLVGVTGADIDPAVLYAEIIPHTGMRPSRFMRGSAALRWSPPTLSK